jgi:hypothetical protein
MRKLLALLAVALTAAVFVPADAMASPVNTTLTGTITQLPQPTFGDAATIEGVGTIAGVGRVSFVADWDTRFAFRDPTNSFTSGQVYLTARNGDTLTLSGGTKDFDVLIVPWTVVDGTGRFASVSGSGTVSFNFPDETLGMTATVALTGTLSR